MFNLTLVRKAERTYSAPFFRYVDEAVGRGGTTHDESCLPQYIYVRTENLIK